MGCAGEDLWQYEIGSIPAGRGGGQRVTDGRQNLSLCRCASAPSILGFMTLSAAKAVVSDAVSSGARQLAGPTFCKLTLQWAGVLWFRDPP